MNCCRIIAAVGLLLFLLAPSRCLGTVTVTAVNGFDSSAPLEATFIRVIAQNTGAAPGEARVELPADSVVQEFDLPPGSRKEAHLFPDRADKLNVEINGEMAYQKEILVRSGARTVLVIREEGNPLQFLAAGARDFPDPLRPAGLSFAPGGVRVLNLRPRDLPRSWWGYRFTDPLLVIHPGGFDAMTPEQRDALRIAATYVSDTVLVSEGRPEAFRGTPVEHLVPGSPGSTSSYTEWPFHFDNARPAPAAVAGLTPHADAVTSVTTTAGAPLVVQRKRSGHTTTWLAFDYSAPPLRPWNSRPFWHALLDLPRSERNAARRVLTDALLERERVRWVWQAPRKGLLMAAAAALMLTYGAALFGSRRLRRHPMQPASWLFGPLLMTSVAAAVMAGAFLLRSRSAGLSETGVITFLDDSAVYVQARAFLTGPGRMRNVSPRSPQTVIVHESSRAGMPGQVRITPESPPVISKAVLEQSGIETFTLQDVSPTPGQVVVSSTLPDPTSYEADVSVENKSAYALKDLRVFAGGRSAAVGDFEPGQTATRQVQLRPGPQPPRRSTSFLPPDMPHDRVLDAEGSRASMTPPPEGAVGIALAQVEGFPPLLDATTTSTYYLALTVEQAP